MNATPFDDVLNHIVQTGYHNHRGPQHSDLVTQGIVRDLKKYCAEIERDLGKGAVRAWHNVRGPDYRNTDLLLAPAIQGNSKPDLGEIRLLIEHKSIVTAHRNRNARQQDIEREVSATHQRDPRTILAATFMVGVCQDVLNVPDCLKKHPNAKGQFNSTVRPRLSTGDQDLWLEFKDCISHNKAGDADKTINFLRHHLPVRKIGDSHALGLDYLLIVPVSIDNVNKPSLAPGYSDQVLREYRAMIGHLCSAYKLRWR
jgi:hypothetical protein